MKWLQYTWFSRGLIYFLNTLVITLVLSVVNAGGFHFLLTKWLRSWMIAFIVLNIIGPLFAKVVGKLVAWTGKAKPDKE